MSSEKPATTQTSNSRQSVQAVLFDLDGTLADTAPDLGGALNRVLIKHARMPLCFAEYRSLAGDGSSALLAAGFDLDRSDSRMDPLRKELLDEYARHICDHTALFPSMADVLEKIESSNVKWGVATNKPSAFTEPLMRALELHERAAVVVSADQVANAKPAPDMLQTAARLIGVDAGRCIYIGDARRDIDAGNAAGMTTLAAAWGYIHASEDIQSWAAAAVITEATEILSFL